mmetsp:Transcript_79757/g.165717  ORF Transcript_79757/g.165717 Transcript_79757/m.165717 type:complete len:255 (-) Transcript_79757:736-1500(-)
MRAVQSEDVRAGRNHLGDHLLAPRRGAQRGNDLRPPLAVVHLSGLQGLADAVVVEESGHDEVLHGLGLKHCSGLGPNGLERILAAGGLSTQHHCVGAIPDGVLKIGDLGTCWHGVFDHALDHLRRRDDEEACFLGFRDEQLLSEGHPVHTKLDAQISSSDHQGLALGDDAIDVGEGLRLLNLGADLRSTIGRDVQTVHDVDELLQILGLLRKGDADVLDGGLQLEEVLGVLDVLFSEGSASDLDVRHVHTFSGL